MLRQIKPRTARSKRALEKKAPKAVENPKKTLFLRGTSCSQVVQDALTDLYELRRPLAHKFTKKNDVHPFESAESLEFFSEKNDASLLCFGSTSKKRPHSLTLVRTFAHRALDMVELHLDPESFRRISQFRTRKFAVGLRPLMVFTGSAFESPLPNEYTVVKSMLTDMFKGETADKIDVEGLQYIVSVSADEPSGLGDDESSPKPAIHLRIYLISTKRSGQRLPRVEVEEMGPRMDLRPGRVQLPDEAAWKEALKRPRGAEERTRKNVATDTMGDKLGRIHLGRQDLSELQTRKMKGLKRNRAVDDEADARADAEAQAESPKKAKK